MIFDDVTIQDCHREAWLESQIKVAQRKIDRLCKQIASKEEIAQRLMSPWFCEHYDNEIGTRYQEMAQLEGAVRAAQLELDRLADKRYADKNVEEISAMVGFANRQSFYAAFYKNVGETPNGYRKKHLENKK